MNEIILVLSGLTVLAYLFNIFSRWTRVPSVVLLLATGILLRLIASQADFLLQIRNELVGFLGTIGLVIIVLEASLDLHLRRDNLPVIRRAFFSSAVILIGSSLAVSTLLHFWLEDLWKNCLIYSIPLSIISSAIVIPSTEHLSVSKREFTVYESSFSDILGIVFFNFITQRSEIDLSTPVGFLMEIVGVFIAGLVASLFIIWLGGKINEGVRHFFLLSLLVLLYALGKAAHLPALIIVLVFGLMLNNFERLIVPRLLPSLNGKGISSLVGQFKMVTSESSFILRTFFFVFFGFSIELSGLLNPVAIGASLVIVAVLLIVRYAYLRWAFKGNIFPEIFLMPRGLITILLFLSIPSQYSIGSFDQSIVFLVVLTSTVLMAIALMLTREELSNAL